MAAFSAPGAIHSSDGIISRLRGVVGLSSKLFWSIFNDAEVCAVDLHKIKIFTLFTKQIMTEHLRVKTKIDPIGDVLI